MVDAAPWLLYATDDSRVITGKIDVWSSLDFTLRHNGPGTWSLQLPAGHPQAKLFAPGARLVAHRYGGDPVLSGPVESITQTLADSAPAPVLEVEGVDDTARLGARLIYPDPANAADAQTVAYDVRTGKAETLVRALVNLNAGPGALAARRIPGLTLEADTASGATVSSSARFESLLLTSADLARAGGIGFRVVQVGGDLRLKFYTPTDKSADVRLSPQLGNLRGYQWTVTAPQVTRALVAGQGEGAARTIIERANTPPEVAWSRRDESFIDARDSDDTATLQQRGDEYLTDKGATAGLKLSPIDTPHHTFGVDYWLGDIVTVDMGGGAVFEDMISEVRVTVDAGGSRTVPTVGDASVSGDTPALYSRVSDLLRRVGRLESRV